MRKQLLCVPMIALLLTACHGGENQHAQELALQIRGDYLAMTACTTTAKLTADYGQRVYEYEVAVSVTGEETRLVIAAPAHIAGITARVTGETGVLEYDGVAVETGPLDESGLTPISAIPALLQAARGGYITTCSMDEAGTLLQMDCGSPEGQPGQGIESSLWFAADTGVLVRGEIRVDGFRAILCEFTDFTRGE